ncbi:unnamed protein product [Parnassius mnemosyne]
MEVDTGAAVSCINRQTYEKYFNHHPIKNSKIVLNCYDGSSVNPLGIIKPVVRHAGRTKRLELFVIEGGTTSLLGRQWLTELGIKIPAFSNNCHHLSNKKESMSNEIKKIFSRYKELFSGGLGRFTGGKATLGVRDGAAPVFHRARPVPYALRERVDAQLDAMLRDGIIESVDCSDWASPIVPVNKADGYLRICADFKATLNPVLQIDRYPLPRIDDLMVKLSGACYYSKIDLSQAYNQIELDDTKKYTVINTHRGLYSFDVWWAGMEEAVERACRECITCAAQADAPARNSPRMWPWPARPWSRLHLDFMGPIAGKIYLVVVDAMSKWIEVHKMTSISANCLIYRLNELFSRFGLPRQIVTDNGAQFTSKEFEYFNKHNGIEHVFTAHYHPSSNGLAENAVRTLKRVIKKALQDNQNIDRVLWAFLMYYRNVEHATTSESPAMLMFGRRIRTLLDVIKPDREGQVHQAQRRQQDAAAGVSRSFGKEEEVWYRQYLKGEKWIPGRIVDVLGSSNFKVEGKDGEIIHRHIDQLRKRQSNSRLSLASTTPILDQQSTRDSQEVHWPIGSSSPARRSEGSAEATSSSPIEVRSGVDQSKLEGAIPESPERQFSLPLGATPRARPVRKCRLNKPSYKE